MDYSLLFYMILLSSLMVHLSYRVRRKDIRVNILFWFSSLFLGTSILSIGFLIFSPEGVSRSLQMIMSLLYGPFLLLAVAEYLNFQIRSLRLYLHFIPFFLLLMCYLILLSQSRWWALTKEEWTIAFHGIAFVSCFLYSIYVLYILYQRMMSGYPGSILIQLFSLFLLLYGVFVIIRMYFSFGGGKVMYEETIPISFYLFSGIVLTGACVWGIQELVQVYLGNQLVEENQKGIYSIEISDNLERVLPMNRLEENLIIFEELMYQDKYFLNPDAGLDRIADLLKIPSYQVTHLVNHVYQMGLPELINRMRIHHACHLIHEFPDKTLISIAEESGYSSESTFFRNFRAYKGFTPRQYQTRILSR